MVYSLLLSDLRVWSRVETEQERHALLSLDLYGRTSEGSSIRRQLGINKVLGGGHWLGCSRSNERRGEVEEFGWRETEVGDGGTRVSA